MKHRGIRAVFLLLALALLPQGLMAWGKTWTGRALQLAVEAAKWKVGPLRIDPVLYLTDAGYDTNLYYGHGGSQIKDYTLTAGPGFTIYLPVRKTLVFEVVESPRYVYYRQTKEERAWNNYLSGRAHLALNRLFVTTGVRLVSARQRWSTEVDIRPRRREAALEGSALWQATKKTSFQLSADRTTYDYENLAYDVFNLQERLNRTEGRLAFRAYHQLTYRARLFVSGEYGDFRFERPAAGGSRDARSYGVFGGVEFAPLGIVRGRINIGYKSLEPESAARSRFRGLAGDSSISVRLLRSLTVRTAYSRDIQFSVWYDNAYYIESRAGAGASLYLFKKIRLDYDYSDGLNRYPVGQTMTAGTQVKRRDDYRIHALGLYFRLKGNIGVGLVANRWHRNSNLAWETDSRDFVGINLTYDF